MAPVEVYHAPSRLPALVVGFHVATTIYASLLLARTAWRSYLALTPSFNTRHREPSRHRHVNAFSILAAVSLLTASFFGLRYAWLSYRVWSLERGVDLPSSIFGEKGAFRSGDHPGQLHLFAWLNDTPIYHDALEIVAEKARHFWWSQQINLGMIAWSMFLAIEGGRRKIPHLWAFMLLSQLVNLSYAQNLFFVALLLTPVPLPTNVKDITRSSIPGTSSRFSKFLQEVTPIKPDNWQPDPGFLMSIALMSYLANFLLPFATNTPSLPSIAFFLKSLPYLPITLPYILPTALGTTRHQSYTSFFRRLLVLSSVFHIVTTFFALHRNTPSESYNRHTLLHPFTHEHRTHSARALAALEKLLGAITEHPSISSIGTDVLLSGLSLGVWAAVKGYDSHSILNLSPPITASTSSSPSAQEPDTPHDISPKRKAGRPRKTAVTASDGATGKSRKAKPEAEADQAYQPTESEQQDVLQGEEDAEEDWEIGALVWGVLAIVGLGGAWAGIAGGGIA